MRMISLVAFAALLAVTAACSKDDPTSTPTPPADSATAKPSEAAPAADVAATEKEVDDLAKEIEAELADEG